MYADSENIPVVEENVAASPGPIETCPIVPLFSLNYAEIIL